VSSVVIIAGGDFPKKEYPRQILRDADSIICCDGNALKAFLRNRKAIFGEDCRQPDAVVGDLDSMPAKLLDEYGDLLVHIEEQDDNDLAKAFHYVLDHIPGVDLITFLATTGKREDHTLGNISLLARYRAEMQLDVTMITDHGYFVPIRGYAELESFQGQQVSIFNLGCSQISAEGLKWEPYAYQQWWQGTLNEATGQRILLHGDGNLVVFRTYNRK
jgi:thiamine pyrophosphokinase